MKIIEVIFLLVVSLTAFLLRLDHYDIYPQRGASHDEFAFAFLGQTFWQDHFPSAWSNLPVYRYPQDKYYFSANDTVYTIVRPDFDHPPLFGMLVGGWAILSGERNFEEISLATIRILPVVLGALSTALVYFLARGYGRRVAALSALIFATVPTFAVASRMALAENLLIPLVLLALLIFEKWQQKRETHWIFWLGVISGLAFLTKFVGIFVYLTILFLLLIRVKTRQQVFILTGVTAVMGASYFFYGLVLNQQLFLKVLFFQGSRQIGPLSLFNLWTKPMIVNKVFIDGWYYFGWFALSVLMTKARKHLKMLTPVLVYLLIYLLTVDQVDHHGWYAYPFYPFLAIASGKLIDRMIKKPTLFNVFFLLTAGLSTFYWSYFNYFGFSSLMFRILLLLFSFPFFLNFLKPSFPAKKIFSFYLIIIFVFNIITVLTFVHPG